tara:strand:+ start:11923 stop:13437 length:1515 start_codon:yes stop_codon:yes gene_type:complete
LKLRTWFFDLTTLAALLLFRFVGQFRSRASYGHVNNASGACSFDQLVGKLEDAGLSGLKYRTGNHGVAVLCLRESDLDTFAKVMWRFFSTAPCMVRLKRHDSWRVLTKANATEKFLGDISWTPVLIEAHPSIRSWMFDLEIWREKDGFVAAPRRNSFFQRVWDIVESRQGIFGGGGFKEMEKLLDQPRTLAPTMDVDLVYTWVNNEDPKWLELIAPFRPQDVTDATSPSRFRSRDELLYSLRSVSMYANFFRKIFIVSNCSPPSWLDLADPRIEWIYHEDILFSSALPTFNSHAIETSLFRIPGLSEHFIYLNDDILFGRPSSVEDFFFSNGIERARFEPYGNLLGSVDESLPDYLNGAINSRNLLEGEFSITFSELITHSARPMRVSVWAQMWDRFGADLGDTMHNKFRSIADINPCLLYAHYSVLRGHAVPDYPPTELIQSNHDFHSKFSSLLARQRFGVRLMPSTICVNDGSDSHNNAEWDEACTRFLDDYFPAPSDFEFR